MAEHRISSIEVCNFRPFDEQEFLIDPERNIVLLYGNNGFGKTSFFDAVEWGLTGKLARYEGAARERNEYGVLKNQFANDGDSWVRLAFSQGRALKRSVRPSGHGDYNEGTVDTDPSTWLIKPEWTSLVDLQEAFNLTHLLTQEQVNRFVRSTKDTDRYAAIVSLFGLSGYEAYNPKLEEIRRQTRQRKEQFEREKNQKEQGIARKESSMGSADIDVRAKRTELAGLLEVETDELPDLQEVQRHIQQASQKLVQELEAAEGKNREIAYVAQNWVACEKNNQRIGELRGFVEENQRLTNACQNLAGCRWVRSVQQDYAAHQANPELATSLVTELSKFLASPQGLLSQCDPENEARMLEFGMSLGGGIAESIRSLIDLRKRLGELTEDAQRLETMLTAQSDLERRLIRLARDFIAENTQITQCPVCKSRIESSQVLQELEDRIHSDSSSFFRENAEKLRSLKGQILDRRQKKQSMDQQVQQILLDQHKQAIASKVSLEERLVTAKQLAATGESVKGWLDHLNTSISVIDQLDQRITADIHSSGAYVEGQETKEFYETRRDQLQAELLSLQKNVVSYNELKTRHKLSSPEELRKTTEQAAAVLTHLKNRKARTDAVTRLTTELLQDDHDSRTRAEIANLKQEIIALDKRIGACEKIENDCGELRAASRRVVEEETNRLLDEYGKTIQKLYVHLNPHVRLGRLEFRIDASNRANNRFVFEAHDPTGQVRVNPSYTFSSAQTNVLAISVFLGIALRQQWSNMNALFLDDPIQNMDDINVHSFVDIIRSVVRDTDKQFFISTHDERVFEFMRRKFRDNVQIFHFTGYGKVTHE